MKLFILVTFISAVVGQLGQESLYPGFSTNPATEEVIAKCTYWKGVEKSICHTYRFKVDNRNMDEFRPHNNMYNMMNGYDKLFGNAQMKAQECSDAMEKDKYWKACPSLYNSNLMTTTDGIHIWDFLSGCAANETLCEESCNLCGEENYITAGKEVEKKTNLRCLKIMDHFPFSCMEKKVVETPLPSIFVIFLNEAVLAATFALTNNEMCVTFNFRRRASADCPLDAISEISVATKKSTTYQSFCASPNPALQVPYDDFDDSNGEKNAKVEDKTYCLFNVWRKAFFVFYNDDEDNGVDDSFLGTELQIIVYRKVDHVDIDAVEIFPGTCGPQITAYSPLDYPTDPVTPIDGVFMGVKTIE